MELWMVPVDSGEMDRFNRDRRKNPPWAILSTTTEATGKVSRWRVTAGRILKGGGGLEGKVGGG